MEAGPVSHEVYFISFHPGGAEHLLAYAQHLRARDVNLGILAAESAYDKIIAGGIQAANMLAGRSVKELKKLPKEELEELFEEVFKTVQQAKAVFFDLGHAFAQPIIMKLKERVPAVILVGCYENPEGFVPGGYSENVGVVAKQVHCLVFSNENFRHMPVYEQEGQLCEFAAKVRATGFFPMSKVNAIATSRYPEMKECAKAEFLKIHEIDKEMETLAVYMGGANTVYFENAFPNFLEMLTQASVQEDLSGLTIIFQQHPRAKDENLDGILLWKWINETATPRCPRIIFSKVASPQSLQVADLVFYYQTSESPQYPLVGIPCIQVGKQFNDLVVSNDIGLSAETSEEFLAAMKSFSEKTTESDEINYAKALKAVGYREDWTLRLDAIMEELLQQKNK